MEPQDAWAASKLASTLGYGNPDDFQSLGPFMTMAVGQHDAARRLKAQELADRAAWERARVLAQIYGADVNAATTLQQQQMRGQQGLDQLQQSTSGLPFGREKLASQEDTQKWKTGQTLANIRAMQGDKMKIAEMNAASRGGKQLPITDFIALWPRIQKSLPPGTDFMTGYEMVNQRLAEIQNPVKQQFRQRQPQQPMAPVPSPWG